MGVPLRQVLISSRPPAHGIVKPQTRPGEEEGHIILRVPNDRFNALPPRSLDLRRATGVKFQP